MAIHTIQIVVINGGTEGSYKANNAMRQQKDTEEKKDYKDTKLYKILNFKETIYKKIESKTSPSMALAIGQSMDIGLQLVKSGMEYHYSDVGRRNGDSNHQAIINRRFEIGANILNAANSIWGGAQAGFGMTGNPLGAVIGAVAGLTSSAINIGFQQAERQREYQHEMFKNNTSQAYNLARANYSVSTGRMR